MTETKTCTKCGVCKPVESFARNKRKQGGIDCWCKQCHRDSTALYAKKNREKVLAATRAWRAANRDHRAAYKRAHRTANDARAIRKWKELHPEAVRSSEKRSRDKLASHYVAARLRRQGAAEITQPLIQLKREQLSLHRLAKELQGAANQSKEPK